MKIERDSSSNKHRNLGRLKLRGFSLLAISILVIIAFAVVAGLWGGFSNFTMYLKNQSSLVTVAATSSELNGSVVIPMEIRNLTHRKMLFASVRPSCPCLQIIDQSTKLLSVPAFGSVSLRIKYEYDPNHQERLMFVTDDGIALTSPVIVSVKGNMNGIEQ